MAQPHPKDSQRHWSSSHGSPGRPATWKVGTKPRSDRLYPPAPEDDLVAALRWPEPFERPDFPRGTPYMACPDHSFGNLSAAECGVEDQAIPGQEQKPSRVSQRQAPGQTQKHEKQLLPEREDHRRATRDKDSESVGVYSWRKGQALVRELLGPPPTRPRLPKEAPPRKPACTAELGDTEKAGAAESSPTRPPTPRPASVPSNPQIPANVPNLTSQEQVVTIQSALSILQELRQQIQAGLKLAQDRHLGGGREHLSPTLQRQELAVRKHRGAWSAPDVRSPFCKSPQAPSKGTASSLERTGSIPSGQRWSTLARWESYPRRTRLVQGQDPAFQTPGSPPERLSCFPQRPWSASAGQRAWATCEELEVPAQGPWNPLERPNPPAQRSWSASFTKRAGTSLKDRGFLLPAWGAKDTWPRPTKRTPQVVPGKENEAWPPCPCPKPREFLGRPYSTESLRAFVHQKARAWRQQTLEEQDSAALGLKPRTHRLQGTYGQPREAVPSKTFPVISQTTPGIVTFVPHSAQSRGLEVPGSLGSPVQQWSKVTSGMVLGDQEAPGSFCLCLNRALNRAETPEAGGPQEGWEGAPRLMSASSSLGPLPLQDLTARHLRPELCIYLDPEEAERLGTPGPLHFRYKQARLQALETMANVLRQRIDILTAKLLRSEEVNSLGDLGSDVPPSCPSTVPAVLTRLAPAWPGVLVPHGGREAPWDCADTPARPLRSCTCFPDSETGWEQQQTTRGFMEDGHSELDKRLVRDMASFQTPSPLARSSLGVPAPPDSTCGSLWLEKTPSARGVGLAMPWTTRRFGQLEPGGPCAQHLADIQQKSLSFLQSLKLVQQKQEQALALLRQRAELEVWEAQKALEELLFEYRQELTGGHVQDTHTLDRSHPPVSGDAAVPSQGSEEGQESQASQSASAEPKQEERPVQAPSQLPPARLYPLDNPIHQWSAAGPLGAKPDAVSGWTVRTQKQRLREEERRAEHRAALLRLREEALVERTRAELARLEQRRGCLGSKGNDAVLVALVEKQQQALCNLEQGQREIQHLHNSHLFWHQERTLLLQHHRDILSVQRSVARLQQELQAPTQLPQSYSPEFKAAQEGGSEASQQPGGSVLGLSCPSAPHGPSSRTNHHACRTPESPGVPPPLPEQQDGTSSRSTSAVDGSLWPLRPAWREETPMADGWPAAQWELLESGHHMGPGDPQTNPSSSSAEEGTCALTESHARSFQGWSQHSQGRGGPCSPWEARRVPEGSPSRVEAELELDFANNSVGEVLEVESQWSEEQRTKTCWQEDLHDPSSWQEEVPPTTCPAPAAAENTMPPAQRQGSPLLQLTTPSALAPLSESAPGTCSGSSVGSRTPSSVSSLSCPSLQEFQKVSAFLVQLSESSISLPDWEASNTPAADPGWSGESSAGDSGRVHQGRGQETRERPVGSGTSPQQSSSTVPGDPESEPGLLHGGWPLPLPKVPSLWLGSELSVGSSEVWDEEDLLEPGPGAQPATVYSLPAGGSSDLETRGVLPTARLSLGPGGGQKVSEASGSLASEPDPGTGSQMAPEAASTASCSHLDQPLFFPSGSLASKGVDCSRGGETGTLQASAGRPEGPWDVNLSPSPNRMPPQAPSTAHPVPEEACLPLRSSVLPEVLSLVGDVLSYGSTDLPSTHRVAPLPPLPPALPADSGAPPSPHSEDFPSPLEDAMSPGGSLGPPEEDISINVCKLPSLSEERPPEALSLGPQESTCCLGEGGQGRSLRDQLGEYSSVEGNQDVGGQWSEPIAWLGSPLCGREATALGRLPGLSVPSPVLSRVACVAGVGLSTLLMAGDMRLPGTWYGDPAPDLNMGPCADLPGVDMAEVVDLVSTQLTRRILCDTLAVFSGQAPPGSPLMEEQASASQVPRSHTAVAGQSWGRRDF